MLNGSEELSIGKIRWVFKLEKEKRFAPARKTFCVDGDVMIITIILILIPIFSSFLLKWWGWRWRELLVLLHLWWWWHCCDGNDRLKTLTLAWQTPTRSDYAHCNSQSSHKPLLFVPPSSSSSSPSSPKAQRFNQLRIQKGLLMPWWVRAAASV